MAKSTKVKVTSTKPAREVVVVAAEEKPGMTWQDGVAIVTTIGLICAILVADKALAGYGAGKFF